MIFESGRQRDVFSTIVRWMEKRFGEAAVPAAEIPVIYVYRGSTVTAVTVYPWRESEAVIEIESELVRAVEKTPDLLEYLLERNYGMRLGGFSVGPRGKVVFRHTLLASTCDKEELVEAVRTVSRFADEEDDKIVSRWGGLMAKEEP